jgi:molecular chaperone GrpE
MTETTARPAKDAAGKPEERAAPDAAAGTPAAAAEPGAAPDAAAEVVREVAELKDKLLRTLAEMENLRRRTAREVIDARQYGIASFARDVLGVADSMDRALQALDHEIREQADAGVKALLDGVELTERELLKVLEKHGVRKFEPQGEKFDPNVHQAMYEVVDASLPAGSVAQVVQPGYMIGERVLRPALVAVSKGGPKVAAPAAAEPPANDNAGSSSADPQDEG